MKVMVIDPFDELELWCHSVINAESARRIDERWRYEERVRGHECERILIRGGTIEIMPRDQPVPSSKEASMLRKIVAGDGLPGDTSP